MTDSTDLRSEPLVVYVDDERANRLVFETSLREFNLITADSGPAAIALLEAHDVAVLVTDMRMPGMSGDQLLRITKDRFPRTIRMVVTAYADVDPILRAINEGLVARYIIKPWQRDELVQILRWACEAWAFSRDSADLHNRLLQTERLATLGSMAGMLVHDLRQPLMSLVVNIEFLRELAASAPTIAAALERAPIDPELRDRLVDRVDDLDQITADLKTSVNHLNTLITSLRDLGRPRAAAEDIPVIDPFPIVRHAMSVCQELALRGCASIGYEGPRELPRIRMLPMELTQVLINVVANGTQAVAARGTPNGRVDILASSADGLLELKIRDDGVGMSPDVLGRAGTPFFTTRADGVGLGIAQCQRLIGTAGGRFHIDSEVGRGTTVTIILPTSV
jgi:hypothetical protein